MRKTLLWFAIPFFMAACGDDKKAAGKPAVTVAPSAPAKAPTPPPPPPLAFDASGKVVFDAGKPGIGTQAGVKEGSVIKATGRAGFAQFGPYVTLAPGNYTVTWVGKIEGAKGKVAGSVDVVSDAGKKVIVPSKPVAAATDQASRPIATVDFSLAAQTPLVEFRFMVAEGTMATVERIELGRK